MTGYNSSYSWISKKELPDCLKASWLQIGDCQMPLVSISPAMYTRLDSDELGVPNSLGFRVSGLENLFSEWCPADSLEFPKTLARAGARRHVDRLSAREAGARPVRTPKV